LDEIANGKGIVRQAFARIGLMAAALALGWLGAAAPASAAEPRPTRIVSLDLCTDQLLIELAERPRIAAITHLAGDPSVSAISEKAAGFAITHGAAEDVLHFDPDLVLAGPFGVSASVNLLRRLGRNVVIVPLPQDFEGVRQAVRTVATAIGAEAKGAAMIADFDARLARLPPPTARPPSAVIYQIGGSVSGPGSLADSALAAAGLRNKSSDYRLSRGGQVPLESLIAMPPDLLVLSSNTQDYRTVLGDNLRHPALRALRARHPFLELPWRHWLCGTPHIADAIERLAEARMRLGAGTQ
jgi:iron complex transport system substrate-binding protein